MFTKSLSSVVGGECWLGLEGQMLRQTALWDTSSNDTFQTKNKLLAFDPYDVEAAMVLRGCSCQSENLAM